MKTEQQNKEMNCGNCALCIHCFDGCECSLSDNKVDEKQEACIDYIKEEE